MRGLVAALATSAVAGGTGFATAPGAGATTSASVCATSAIVGVSGNGDLNRWVDTTAGTAGGFATATEVGQNFGAARLTASDAASGALFVIFDDGSLHRYLFDGTRYRNGVQLSAAGVWGTATNLLPMGDGILYATFTGGDMRMYTVTSTSISGPSSPIGTNWDSMKSIASGGAGIIYAVDKATGTLHWYKRSNFASPDGTFSARKEIGTGWGGFTNLLGAGDGILYAIQTDGALRWYNHAAATTGAASWANGSGAVIGKGWNTTKALTVNPDACSPGSEYSAPGANPYPSATGASGSMTPRTKFVDGQIESRFLGTDCGTYATGGGDHSTGNALDCAAGSYGSYPSASERAEMKALADWSVKYAATLKISYVIFEQKIWNIARASEGWRAMEDRGSVTQNHFDHVHISVQNPGTASSLRAVEAGYAW